MKKGGGKNGKSMTIDRLGRMVADGFAKTATKAEVATIREEVTTIREEVTTLREEMVTKKELQTVLTAFRSDIDFLFERHIGTFRRDYDELARRVKKIEEAVFRRK